MFLEARSSVFAMSAQWRWPCVGLSVGLVLAKRMLNVCSLYVQNFIKRAISIN